MRSAFLAAERSRRSQTFLSRLAESAQPNSPGVAKKLPPLPELDAETKNKLTALRGRYDYNHDVRESLAPLCAKLGNLFAGRSHDVEALTTQLGFDPLNVYDALNNESAAEDWHGLIEMAGVRENGRALELVEAALAAASKS